MAGGLEGEPLRGHCLDRLRQDKVDCPQSEQRIWRSEVKDRHRIDLVVRHGLVMRLSRLPLKSAMMKSKLWGSRSLNGHVSWKSLMSLLQILS